MKLAVPLIIFVLLSANVYAGTESVTLIKVLENDDKGIIERQNGERWLIEKGVGALSFWRFKGKKILIYSPGLFCGVGSKVILPDVGQEARIWDAELLDAGNPTRAVHSERDLQLATEALVVLGYFSAKSPDQVKQNTAPSLKVFQKEHKLPETGKVSFDTQVALSKAIGDKRPISGQTLALASELLQSAKRMLAGTAGEDALIESNIDGDFEGWDGETVVKLTNGQVWQQSEYYYHYHYAFMPKVVIIKSGIGFKMLVEGISKAVGVTRLN